LPTATLRTIFRPEVELQQIFGGAVQVAQNARRDRQQDFLARAFDGVVAEQITQHRNVTQTGQTIGGGGFVRAQQARQHLGFTVAQGQRGGGIARANLVCGGARVDHGVGDRADLQHGLDDDIVVELDGRLKLKFDTDIQIAHRRAGGPGGGTRIRGGGDDRHLVANMKLGFFPIAHTNARIGQNVDVA